MPVAAPTAAVSSNASLIAALQAAQPEPAIEQAFRHIASRGADVPLLLAMAAALIRADLAGLAGTFLRSAGERACANDSVRAMLDQIAALPTGELNRDELRARYQRNIHALLSCRPQLTSPLLDAGLPDNVHIYQSRAGNLHAVREVSAPRLDTVFPFIDFRATAAGMRLPQADLSTSHLLVGVPSPQMLQRLIGVNVDGYRPPIDIIESDCEAMIIWLHMLDDPNLWTDSRVRLFVGANAAGDYRRFIINTPGRIPASLILTNHRPPPHGHPPRVDGAMMTQIGMEIRERQIAQRTRLDQRLARCDVAFWRERFAHAGRSMPPLRVVGFTNRYSTVIQHAMRDLAAAFRRKGHDFDIIAQPDDCCAAVDVAAALTHNDRQFDLLVAINHLRFEYADAMPRNVPFVGWIQDHMDHLWKKQAGVSLGGVDLVVSHSPHVLASLYGYPIDRVLASSNLTDPHVYSDEALPDDELRPHRCDLSFVSHGAATPEMLVDELGAVTTPAFHDLLRCFLRIVRTELERAGCVNAQRLVELMLRAEKESGRPSLSPEVRRAHVYPQIAKIHDRLFRHQTLEWAANWARANGRTLRIYGRGWDKHATLNKFACGEALSGRELRAVYQASKISLQANAYSSLHQRLLDGLASGACVFSRYNPADFVRQPFAKISQTISNVGLKSLSDLLTLRGSDSTFASACEDAERLSGAIIAPLNDPRRRAQMCILREGNDIAELQTDDGLFAVLRDMRFMPARVAGDLPGFEQTVFRNESGMHDLLNRLANNDELRRSTAYPMREAVLANDTFDVLAGRIIRTFAGENAA